MRGTVGMADKKWKFVPHDRVLIQRLSEQAKISPVVAQLLLRRGISEPQAAQEFLEAKLSGLRPPEELPGVPQAVEQIMRARDAGHEIVVHGDYDADGMTGTAILFRCLSLLGCKASYFLPNRMEEGYGLHADIVERFAAQGKRMIVTVDCGIASIEAADRARQLGVSVIITDHHRFGDRLPAADAIVHPALPDAGYPFVDLCGAGVAFKLAWALCQHHTGSPKVAQHLRDFLLQALGLAAIGTVADVVPLIDENRILVRNGLKMLATHPPLGVKKLKELSQLSSKLALDSEDIAFTLAPRLNAAGRLGQAQLGVELLVTQEEARAAALASYILELNETRNKLERSIHLAASKQLKQVHSIQDDPAFVLTSPGWHPGVIGIVAAKLAEKYHRPVVLIAQDKLGTKPAIGSGRSPNGVNLHQALLQCRELLVSGGGHAAAAGLKINEGNLSTFRAAFLEAVAEQSSDVQHGAELEFDAEAALGQLDLSTMIQIEQLAPFGMSNSRPLFCATAVRMDQPPKPLGDSGKHLSMQLVQHGWKMRAVAFGHAEEWLPTLMQHTDDLIDLAFRPVINEYRGFRKVELHLVDWRLHSQQPASLLSVG
ncbi:MAG: single-stranded-DNA-specific exonuclease RecJ [Pirellulaceae bacterium]|nr:single-stranded-DNA-specific exonuclease RecJ [Pirellulaceae bacterium]